MKLKRIIILERFGEEINTPNFFITKSNIYDNLYYMIYTL